MENVDPAKVLFLLVAALTCLIGFGLLMGIRARRRQPFSDFASLYGDNTDPPQPGDYKWKPAMDNRSRHNNPMFDEDPIVRDVSRHLAKKELAHNAAVNAEAELLKRLDGENPPPQKPRFHCEPINIGLGYDQFGNNEYLLHPDDKAYIERTGVNRAGGDVVCEHCGYTYYMHPPVQGALYLTRVCSREPMGRLVKL